MSKDYVMELRELFDTLTLNEFGDKIRIKQFFSGAAGYIDGMIFLSSTNVGLGLKLSNQDLEYLRGEGGKELKYFPKGYVKKQYLIVPNHIKENREKLTELILKSICFVQSIEK